MAVVGGLLILIGLAGMAVATWALVKGGLGWANIASRKVAGGVLAGGLAVAIVGGGISPQDDDKSDNVAVQDGVGSTTTSIPASPTSSTGATTTTAAPTTTTSAPTTTTTALATTTTTRPATTSTTARPTTTTTRPATTTTPAPLATTTTAAPAGTCTASVDNPSPLSGGNVKVSVSTNVPNAGFTATAHYKSKNTPLSGTTDGAGNGSVTFDTGSATKGYTVKVDVNVSGKATCQTEFTPI